MTVEYPLPEPLKRYSLDACCYGEHDPDKYIDTPTKLECTERSDGEWVRFEDVRKLLVGWNGYGWKDRQYADDIQEYFNVALSE